MVDVWEKCGVFVVEEDHWIRQKKRMRNRKNRGGWICWWVWWLRVVVVGEKGVVEFGVGANVWFVRGRET